MTGGSGPAGDDIDARLARAGLPPLPRTAWLEIDLDALRHNLAVVRRLAGEGVPIHAVVKANAYGHGMIEIAHALAAEGVDGFCVATADEALLLRSAAIREPILVLYPVPPPAAAELARRRIWVTAGDPDLLTALAAVTAERDAGASGPEGGTDGKPPRLGVQLEVETGLGRGGFLPSQLDAMASVVATAPGLRLVGAWTHLQAPEDEARTAAQAARFDAALAVLRRGGHRLRARHIAGSGALLLGNVASLDGVRPGLALYGLAPDEVAGSPGVVAAGLRPILSLHARPVRVLEVPAGWGISYGPSFVTKRPSRIATLPLGYGDGWPRALSNRASGLVRGRRVPLVGTVAMDAVMADVTDVPGRPVDPSDEFVLLGNQGDEGITALELAAARRTNAWEVVTAMAARLPRVYHAAPDALGLRTLVAASDPEPPMASRRRSNRS